jgi:Kae1-associated kinase Bud32
VEVVNPLNIVKENVIYKGAEANLYYGRWFNKEVIFKYRVPKNYRINELDIRIRNERTLNEARALIKVKNFKLNVPQVYEIDIINSIIVMKFIQGDKLKNILKTLDYSKKEEIFKKIGHDIAILHINGHIHGDITTSNIIVTKNQKIFYIDFGLHEYSEMVEDKSVDIHLLKRVLISSHGDDMEICFNAFLEGYKDEYNKYNSNECEQIIKNISAIETRGRYVKKEERK